MKLVYLSLGSVPLTNMLMAGYHPWHSLREGGRKHRTKIPSRMCLQWETTSDGPASALNFLLSAALLLAVSPPLQGGPSWPELCGPVYRLPSAAHPVLAPVAEQGTGSYRVRPGEFKFKSLQVQSHPGPTFFALQQDGRRNTRKPCVTSTTLRCSRRLLFLLREFAALLQQYLPKPNPKLQQLQAGPKGTCPVTNVAKLSHWHLGLGKSLTKT